MNARKTVNGVQHLVWRDSRCYICGELVGVAGELCADCRTEAANAQRCPCGEEVVVVNFRYGLHYDAKDPAQLCAQSNALTRDGWEELIIDALVDAGLAITYEFEAAVRDHGSATAHFVDTFFGTWNKVLSNQLPKFAFDSSQWVDLATDPPKSIEPTTAQHPVPREQRPDADNEGPKHPSARYN
jgi:hypothetical protein